MTVSEPQLVNYGDRLAALGRTIPDAPALTVVRPDGARSTLSYAQLHARSDSVAGLFTEHGVGPASRVAVALGNCEEHVVASWAAWKLGAQVLPLSRSLPQQERDAVLALAKPDLLVSTWEDVPSLHPDKLTTSPPLADPLAYLTPSPGKCIGSGGSTGRPKLIVDLAPLERMPGDCIGPIGTLVGFYESQVQLVLGPLYHNMPFSWCAAGIFEAKHVVVLERFDARVALKVIEHERVEFMTIVPTMMRRIGQVPDVRARDVSSLRGVLHSAAPCPPELKREWIDFVGATKLFEAFGATESVGLTLIRGDEWLDHPGSVGRGALGTEIEILDEHGATVPPGAVGEIYMRIPAAVESYVYVGAEPAAMTPEGFTSLGDLGWLDESGYLFHADRRVDLIVTGGANVYPAEIEARLLEHPAVADVAVIGLPDPEWGKRVHAVVQVSPEHAPTLEAELDALCRTTLAGYKVPKSYELVREFPRSESGKIRRTQMVTDRTS